MSRFSTIDGQHSALRDLERQRLEKLMGQLRREVEPTAKARRFQPPRRKERVSKARNEREVLPRDAPCTANEHSCVPMPPLPRTTTPRGTMNALSAPTAPSAEMAWLLRVSERFDEEAAQVHAFLAEHSLEQYAALLESGPGAPGSSMEALQAASAELLEQVGLPPSPRRRLLNALEVQSDLNSEAQPQGDDDFAPHWGRLGRMPLGWHRCEGRNARVVTRSEPVSHADAAVGDDSPTRAVEVMDEVMIPSTSSKAIGNSEELHHSSQPAEQVHHAATSSRPGSSSGAEKGCCYQCYRKVYLSVAFHLSPEVGSRPGTPFDGDSRVFCSTTCIDGFREALAVRNQRAAELCKLREALSGNVEAPLPQVHENVSDQ